MKVSSGDTELVTTGVNCIEGGPSARQNSFLLKAFRFIKPGYNPVNEACTKTALEYLEKSAAVKKALSH